MLFITLYIACFGLRLTVSQDICSLPPVVGMCRAYFPQYYYNYNTGICDCFMYGGCGGNENKFDTQEQCVRRCGARINSFTTENCSRIFNNNNPETSFANVGNYPSSAQDERGTVGSSSLNSQNKGHSSQQSAFNSFDTQTSGQSILNSNSNFLNSVQGSNTQSGRNPNSNSNFPFSSQDTSFQSSGRPVSNSQDFSQDSSFQSDRITNSNSQFSPQETSFQASGKPIANSNFQDSFQDSSLQSSQIPSSGLSNSQLFNDPNSNSDIYPMPAPALPFPPIKPPRFFPTIISPGKEEYTNEESGRRISQTALNSEQDSSDVSDDRRLRKMIAKIFTASSIGQRFTPD